MNGDSSISPKTVSSQQTTIKTTMISTPFLALREATSEPDTDADGLMYPVALDKPNAVALESADGGDPYAITCTNFAMHTPGSVGPTMRIKDIRAAVLITETRLIFACSKYEKGGGWSGIGVGALLTIPANLGSKALAAHRRHGKMMVGHVRYPWINGVFAKNKIGWKAHKALSLTIKSGGQLWQLDFTLPHDADSPAVARLLVRHAAEFRLAHEVRGESEDVVSKREKLLELAEQPVLRPVNGNALEGVLFPTHWSIDRKSARIGLNDDKHPAA
jgi:hypothetical protein